VFCLEGTSDLNWQTGARQQSGEHLGSCSSCPMVVASAGGSCSAGIVLSHAVACGGVWRFGLHVPF